MSDRTVIKNVGKILVPFLVYYITVLVVMAAAQLAVGTDEAHYAACQLIAALVTIPVMLPYYRSDQAMEGGRTLRQCMGKEMAYHVAVIVVIAALLGMALNNLISMSPLVAMSEGYQKANRNFYGSTAGLEIISSAVVTPVLEELVFRGIIFQRMKQISGNGIAVPASAFLFGIMHFNLVQFVYAFLIGLVLALAMEKAGHLYGAIAGHMAANLIAVVRTETGIFAGTVDGSPFAWCISALLLLAGMAVLVLYLYREKCKKG